MYVRAGENKLRDIETLLSGYYSSLHVHGIVEPVPDMAHHFRTWLLCKTRWGTSAGWAHAIEKHSHRRDHLAEFFDFVDQFA